MKILLSYSIIAVLALTAEKLWPARRKPLFRRGLLTDAIYVVVNIGLRILLTNTIAITFTTIATEHLPGWVPVGVMTGYPIWVQSIAVVVVLDFFFYWMHRAKHHWNWWWRLHETHHSSVDLDWFSSVRFHPVEKVTDRLIYLFPLTFLGVAPEALFVLSLVDAIVASFIHMNVNVRIGPLIYILVGPEMHRWHHSVDRDGQRSNFGNNLSIFDWIFGTARLREEFPTKFGCGDEAYPEGPPPFEGSVRNWLTAPFTAASYYAKQFLFAFRPRSSMPD